jgi:hypothetical protein
MIKEPGIEPYPDPSRSTDDKRQLENATRWFKALREAFPKTSTYTETLNPASVAANTTAEQTFTVAGVDVNDIITVNKPSLTSGIGIVGARASAANQIAITFVNATAGAIDPPSEAYKIISVRL